MTQVQEGFDLWPTSKLTDVVLEMVPVDDLPKDSLLIGQAPDEEFIDSVREFGILQPIGVIPTGSGYEVAFGRRRLRAARAAELKVIPARVFPMGWAVSQALALVENSQRRVNAASDYVAITDLMKKGCLKREIALLMGMPVSTIEARLRLGTLPPILLDALLHGELSLSMAQSVIALPEAARNKLSGVYAQNRKLTGDDLHRQRQVQTNAMAEAVGTLVDVLAPRPASATAHEVEMSLVKWDDATYAISAVVDGQRFAGVVKDMQLVSLLRQAGVLKPDTTPEPIPVFETAPEPVVEPEPQPVIEAVVVAEAPVVKTPAKRGPKPKAQPVTAAVAVKPVKAAKPAKAVKPVKAVKEKQYA